MRNYARYFFSLCGLALLALLHLQCDMIAGACVPLASAVGGSAGSANSGGAGGSQNTGGMSGGMSGAGAGAGAGGADGSVLIEVSELIDDIEDGDSSIIEADGRRGQRQPC